jgi:hypothetical protein
VRSHRGVGELQFASSTHFTHLPVPGLQIGVVPGHSDDLVQSVPHVCVVELQTGLSFGHSDDFVHSTHVLVEVSHLSFGATQWVESVAVHSTQTPLSQTCAEPVQSVLVVQPVVQVWLVVLHFAFAPVQSRSPLHATHTSLTGSQAGFADVHAVMFAGAAERHSTHWP